ncbi:MAG: ABC transporter ATP-binding protein [Pseudomonadota bacterium]
MDSFTIQLCGIHKGYPEADTFRKVLAGLDLQVAAAETCAIMGPSGSGKSTLLNLIGAMELPDTGTIDVAGHTLTTLPERSRTLFRRRLLGFVFQQFNLVPTLTVLENLLLPLELNGRLNAAGRRAAQDLLGRVGLSDRGASFPEHLSGGERQRVAIARALVHEPVLLIADEPTGSLDGATATTVLELFGALCGERGTTVLMATHSREVAARADRILDLRDGRLEPAGDT